MTRSSADSIKRRLSQNQDPLSGMLNECEPPETKDKKTDPVSKPIDNEKTVTIEKRRLMSLIRRRHNFIDFGKDTFLSEVKEIEDSLKTIRIPCLPCSAEVTIGFCPGENESEDRFTDNGTLKRVYPELDELLLSKMSAQKDYWDKLMARFGVTYSKGKVTSVAGAKGETDFENFFSFIKIVFEHKKSN